MGLFWREDESLFDPADAFTPEHLPEPGPFLAGHEILTDDAHVEFHQISNRVFERRGVYDMTFNYNLARLNRDTRHPNAGYRYAIDADNDAVLRAEFTPTTPFCPQTHTLTIGSFRAWNGERDEHQFELVKVRSAPMHHQSEAVNDQLVAIEREFERTNDVDSFVDLDTDFGTR